MLINSALFSYMKVIINADDFGYTKAVTEGIIEGYHRGIIRSTTALCNMGYVEYGKKLLKDCPDLAVGVHLTLTLGKSLTENQTLTDEFGYFYKPEMLREHMFDPQEVYLEFKAQIEKYIEIFGRKPSHLDSHHGMHDFHDNYLATERLAKEYQLPVRRYSDYLFVKEFVNEKISVEGLIDILEKYKNKNIEIMTHPGNCDLELYEKSSYSLNRVVELSILCHQDIKDYIKENKIVVTNYLGESYEENTYR